MRERKVSLVDQTMGPLDKLGTAAQKALADEGCVLRELSFSSRLPGNDGPVTATLIIEWDPDNAKKPDVIEIQLEKSVKDAMKDGHRERTREQAKKAEEDLKNLDLDRPGRKGFLD